MHGRKTVDNYNRFPIKTLFGVAINCTQKHLLLLPLLPLFRFTSSSPQELPLHLLCCNFLKALSFFSPVLAHAYCWHHLCSLSAPVLTNTAHPDSLCPLNPHFPLGGVLTIHLHTVVMVWGPGTQQTAEITQVIHENQVQDHPSRKEVIFIAVRYRAWIQPEKTYYSGPPANTPFWCSYLRHTLE